MSNNRIPNPFLLKEPWHARNVLASKQSRFQRSKVKPVRDLEHKKQTELEIIVVGTSAPPLRFQRLSADSLIFSIYTKILLRSLMFAVASGI